jgi:release factor glutamine methyltransferase
VSESGDDGAALTIRAAWAQVAEVLDDRPAARWLCEVATALDGDELVAALDEPMTERMVAHLDAMVARYRTGEPLAHVLGRWSFRHLDLAVDRRVLIPRPETEEVAGVAIERAAARHRLTGSVVAVDLGTGSGAIGLSLAQELPLTGTTVWITDRSEDALEVARANLAGVGRCATNVRVAAGDWFDALPADLLADVVVANPPYVADESPELAASVRDWEPAEALFAGSDGLDDLRRLVADAPAHLRPGGWLVLEIGADQGAAVADLLHRHGYVEVAIRPDLAGRDRIAIGRRPGPTEG